MDIGYKVFSLQPRPLITEHGDLNISRSIEDTLYNMMAQSGKELHLPIETIEEKALYKIDDCYYLVAKCTFDLTNIDDNRIYINGYANIDMATWLNKISLNKENVTVLY